MKIRIWCLVIIGLVLSLSPNIASASPKIDSSYKMDTGLNIASSKTVSVDVKAHVEVLIARLTEIKNMDKSNLKYSEKKLLRKEVKAIQSELVKGNNGVYLSFGAIIVVILLLIILL